MLSITTGYAREKGDPSPDLRHIAEAGFSHVHWGHQIPQSPVDQNCDTVRTRTSTLDRYEDQEKGLKR